MRRHIARKLRTLVAGAVVTLLFAGPSPAESPAATPSATVRQTWRVFVPPRVAVTAPSLTAILHGDGSHAAAAEWTIRANSSQGTQLTVSLSASDIARSTEPRRLPLTGAPLTITPRLRALGSSLWKSSGDDGLDMRPHPDPSLAEWSAATPGSGSYSLRLELQGRDSVPHEHRSPWTITLELTEGM